MNAFQLHVRVRRARRALADLPPSGEAGDAMVGIGMICVLSALGALLLARVL